MSALVDPASLPGVWRGGEMERPPVAVVPTGHGLLDVQLPGGGLPRGGLVEVLHDSPGLGEVSLVLGAIAQLSTEGRAIAWVNPPHLPYAPALAAAGISLDACLVVRPASPEDALWSADQSLRSGACGAALLWLPDRLDYAWLRRLQMAAEAGACLAIAFRPARFASQATAAHLRLEVTAQVGQVRFGILKRRGPPLQHPLSFPLAGRPAPAHIPPALAASDPLTAGRRPTAHRIPPPASQIASHVIRLPV